MIPAATGLPVAVTGHQPHLLGGYGPEAAARLRRLADAWVGRARPAEVVSGMAAGWDMAMAAAAVAAGVPLVAALAWPAQGEGWPEEALGEFRGLLAAAKEVHVHAPGRRSGMWAARDRWVLERGRAVVALWSGAPGGTADAVSRALAMGLPVENLWEEWLLDAPSATG